MDYCVSFLSHVLKLEDKLVSLFEELGWDPVGSVVAFPFNTVLINVVVDALASDTRDGFLRESWDGVCEGWDGTEGWFAGY